MSSPILQLVDVVKTFDVAGRPVRALQGVNLLVEPGQAVGLIGESGSGKSTLARIALGTLPADRGQVIFAGAPWSEGGRDEQTRRRAGVSIVFQDPAASLNPRLSVGALVLEPIRLHRAALPAGEQEALARRALDLAHLSGSLWDRYPRQLSGGQQQRVAIARAIAVEPKLIVLDEPTAALDAVVRGGVLSTLNEMRERLGVSYLLITHDMATAADLTERLVVLYRGDVVEHGRTADVLRAPVHPYTKALLSAVLTADDTEDSWYRLRGRPSIAAAEDGCVLYGRCPEAVDRCVGGRIVVRIGGADHGVRCVHAADAVSGAGTDPPTLPEASSA